MHLVLQYAYGGSDFKTFESLDPETQRLTKDRQQKTKVKKMLIAHLNLQIKSTDWMQICWNRANCKCKISFSSNKIPDTSYSSNSTWVPWSRQLLSRNYVPAYTTTFLIRFYADNRITVLPHQLCSHYLTLADYSLFLKFELKIKSHLFTIFQLSKELI